MESSKSIFLLTCSLSPFSLGETNKGCPDPAANGLLLDASAKETGCCSSFCFFTRLVDISCRFFFEGEREGCVDLHSTAYQLPQSQKTGHFMYLLNPTPLPPLTQLHFSFFPPVLFTHSHLEPAQTGSVNQHACK